MDRMSGIGGTDAAAIAGVNPYKAPIDVYKEKRRLVEPKSENSAMTWGLLEEPIIADFYARRHGVELVSPGVMVHPEHSFVLGSPDRLIAGQEKGLEIKTSSGRMAHKWGEQGSDEIPEMYIVQCAWYMLLTGYESWDVAVKIDSADYREYTISRSSKLEERLFEVCYDFWKNHILEGVPPEADGSNSYTKYIQEAYPQDSGELITVPPGDRIMDNINQLFELRAVLNRVEEDKEITENIIKAYIGEHSGIKGDGWKITWKTTKSTSKVNYEKLSGMLAARIGNPEIVKELTAACMETKPGIRRFLASA